MQRLTLAGGIPENLKGSIVALGNFDGFHLGHQAVARRAVARAFHERRPAIVATFDPHPVRFFKPDLPPFRLTTLDQRERLFAHAGADGMLVFEFGEALRSTSAEEFITELLGKQIGAAGVVTGDDFTFGRARGGNVDLLRTLGAEHGIVAEAVAPVLLGGERISSGRIREALAAGDIPTATRLLSRDFAIEGIVQRGDQRGRELGYPTANMSLGDYQRPRYGIYAVRGLLPDGRVLDGAANLGIRPSFDPPKELLEPHFFDFAENLYDQVIEVQLIHFLRPEARYDGLDPLMAAIAKDCEDARQILAGTPHLA